MVSSAGHELEFRDLDGFDTPVLERILACLVISRMPERGLPEALASLRELYEFYSAQRPHPLAAHSQTGTYLTTITEDRKRPDLIIGR
jgi:hypothetical protein